MGFNEQQQTQQQSAETQAQAGVRYKSKLFNALNRFAGALATPVGNPLQIKYGKAYDYLISGDTLRYRDEIDNAVNQYKSALEISPDFIEAHIGIAKCLRRKGDAMGAIQYFQSALKLNAFRKELHLEIAKCYTECGFLAKAIRHYEMTIKLDDTLIDAKFGLALVLEINEEIERAVTIYQDIIRQDNEFLPAYNNLGSLYMRLGLYDKSEMLFRKLIGKVGGAFTSTATQHGRGTPCTCRRSRVHAWSLWERDSEGCGQPGPWRKPTPRWC
mgnify:CR=1 FL=1